MNLNQTLRFFLCLKFITRIWMENEKTMENLSCMHNNNIYMYGMWYQSQLNEKEGGNNERINEHKNLKRRRLEGGRHWQFSLKNSSVIAWNYFLFCKKKWKWWKRIKLLSSGSRVCTVAAAVWTIITHI